jgi:NAD(P)-dependent dehydrogenase (short-subunit alcohol dehydrogenase family)
MASAVCLVQGASRGIGLGLCRALLARSAETSVIATCRNPDNARDLQELHDKHNKQLTVLQVDATDARQIERAASDVQKQFGHLDLLINSAGIIHPSGHGEKQLKDVTSEVSVQFSLTFSLPKSQLCDS